MGCGWSNPVMAKEREYPEGAIRRNKHTPPPACYKLDMAVQTVGDCSHWKDCLWSTPPAVHTAKGVRPGPLQRCVEARYVDCFRSDLSLRSISPILLAMCAH